ncbi:MAG: hypothetical protein ACREOZ_00825, partial [Gloeomargaritales cyanobacterium]
MSLPSRKGEYLHNAAISASPLRYLNNVEDEKQYPTAHIVSRGAKLYGRSSSQFMESTNEANKPVRKGAR